MKNLKVGQDVFFSRSEKIISGKIERNNGITKGTYTVSYTDNNIDYIDVFESRKLYPNKGDVLCDILDNINYNIESKERRIEGYKKEIEQANEYVKEQQKKKEEILKANS